jgi:hypothetical protein
MALADFRYSDQGADLVGQLARPAGPGPHPAVLIAHEIDGVGVNVAAGPRCWPSSVMSRSQATCMAAASSMRATPRARR